CPLVASVLLLPLPILAALGPTVVIAPQRSFVANGELESIDAQHLIACPQRETAKDRRRDPKAVQDRPFISPIPRHDAVTWAGSTGRAARDIPRAPRCAPRPRPPKPQRRPARPCPSRSRSRPGGPACAPA